MKVTAHEFDSEFTDLVHQERGINRQVVEMIAFCIKRRFYAELGYSSVLSWLVEAHGYPKNSAYRRIEAAKLVTSVPRAIEKLEEGKVNLSTLAKLQSAIRREEERTSQKIAPERKVELFAMIENKTEEQTERLVATEFPEIVKDKVESVKPVSATETRITTVFNDEQMAVLERVREITGHSHFNASWTELMVVMAECFLKHNDPVQKAQRSMKRAEMKLAKSSVTEPSRDQMPSDIHQRPVDDGQSSASTGPVPARLRNSIIHREGARCCFVDPLSKRRCEARTHLEVDHILPRRDGGSNNPENLRTFCREHNHLEAIARFGRVKMNQFLREPGVRYGA